MSGETITRIYERWEVDFPGHGATWSGYRTEAEAEAVVRSSSRPAVARRVVFEVTFEVGSRMHALALPGIAERAS